MVKRLFDIVSAGTVMIILCPFLFLIGLLIALESRGGAFYFQTRVGKDHKTFKLIKFRSMRPGSDKMGQLTVGERDPRITRMGLFVRKFKIDEFPQLINVILGDMSIVGPRPEVTKYVEMYDEVQRKVLSVRPGLTDYASIEYMDENAILAKAADPEKEYINTIMPAKLKLNLKYIDEAGLMTDLKIIFRTIFKIFSAR